MVRDLGGTHALLHAVVLDELVDGALGEFIVGQADSMHEVVTDELLSFASWQNVVIHVHRGHLPVRVAVPPAVAGVAEVPTSHELAGRATGGRCRAGEHTVRHHGEGGARLVVTIGGVRGFTEKL